MSSPFSLLNDGQTKTALKDHESHVISIAITSILCFLFTYILQCQNFQLKRSSGPEIRGKRSNDPVIKGKGSNDPVIKRKGSNGPVANEQGI